MTSINQRESVVSFDTSSSSLNECVVKVVGNKQELAVVVGCGAKLAGKKETNMARSIKPRERKELANKL